jgi:methylmalonyl-CoA/ethylmalonyl-CoA epimerase
LRVDHVAIAVNSVSEAIKNYENVLKIDKIDIEDVPTERVKVAILRLEDTRIELMEPTADDSPIKKFLTERGEGIHHIAITADDIETDVERAIAGGTRMIGNIRIGSYGRKITFIHPKSMHGVLTEFCQVPPENKD